MERLSGEVIVVLGAAVRPDGTPSAALARRIAHAVELARARPRALLVATGGRGVHGPPEADVMAAHALAAGIAAERVLRERHATNTGESARLCARLLRERGVAGPGAPPGGRVVIVTDAWHQRRARLAFRRMRLGARDGVVLESSSPEGGVGGALRTRAVRALREWIGLAWYALTFRG
ncbi:MAG: YdcF family protein [Myxococcota bacterium]